ncbi:MAG TPA: porin [Verrucomicrobiae bacterium]
MKLNQLLIVTFVGAQFAVAAFADDATNNSTEAAEIAALKQEIQKLDQKVSDLEGRSQVAQPATASSDAAQIQDLDQKVRILSREREIDQDAAATTAKTQPKITLGASGFGFSSADSNFVATIHGLIQVDSRTFSQDDHVQGNDSILLRRARPIITGTVFRDFDFNFTPEFGNGTPGAATTPSIYDAYLNYRYSPWFQVEAGKFKPPVGLEYLQSDTYTSFNERSLVTDLIPGRDLGFELHGDISGGVVSYAAGIFNGVGDGQKNTTSIGFQNNRGFDGRLFVQPFKATGIAALQNFGFGAGGSWDSSSITNTLGLPNTTGGSQPGFYTDGQQQFFAYSSGVVAARTHKRLSPQAYYYYGPLSLLGEYAISGQQVSKGAASVDLQNTAWEISGGWVLTGEDATFNGVTPRHNFDPRNGGWGALQVVARYAELNVDKAAFPVFADPTLSASGAQAWSLGLNWYLNKNIRVNASYSHTAFTGGAAANIIATSAPGSVSSHPEDVFFTRVQLSF